LYPSITFLNTSTTNKKNRGDIVHPFLIPIQSLKKLEADMFIEITKEEHSKHPSTQLMKEILKNVWINIGK
jgi:hypothetical protein